MPVVARLVRPQILIAALLLVLLGIVTALLPHFEGIQQIMHRIAETALILDQLAKAIEIAAGPILDPGTP